MSAFLVTGAAGFIGSSLIHALNRDGFFNILAADSLGSSERWRNLVDLQFSDYIEADDLLELIRADDFCLAGIRTVFHLGACSDTTERDLRYLLKNNVEYSKALAGWTLSKGRRYIGASSAATYGDGQAGMSDESDLSQLRPLNAYAWSKHLFDCFAEHQGWLNKMVNVKFFNVYGSRESHKGRMASMVFQAYQEIQSTGRLRLFQSHAVNVADGEQRRDFLFVEDAVAALRFFAECEACGIFNVGSGAARSFRELGETVFRELGLEPAIDFIPMPAHLRGNYQYYTRAQIEKLRRAGFTRAMTPLEEGVRQSVSALQDSR